MKTSNKRFAMSVFLTAVFVALAVVVVAQKGTSIITRIKFARLSKSADPVYDFGAFQTPGLIPKELTMSRTILLVAALACAIILVGCSKTETANNNNANSGTTAGSSASSTPATTAASSSTGDKLGIPECDEYITKYEACTGKVPEVARAQYKAALVQVRASWKQLASNPATKSSLAAACKQAADAQAAAWKTYGCN